MMRTQTKLSVGMMTLLVLVVSSVALLPFYMMFVMGTYRTAELYQGLKLVPGNYVMQNLITLSRIRILLYYRNTLMISVGATALCVLVCSMVGYAIAKYDFRGKKLMFHFIMLTLMVPAQLGLVGFFMEMSRLGWINTLWPLIIPPAASAFGAFWMIQYTRSAIPMEVLDSGRIDGCGEVRLFASIALPFMKPACLTLALMSFLWSWNNLLMPTIILSNNDLFPITLGIKELANIFFTDIGAQVLGLSLTSIPILILFVIFSKNLIDGLAVGAVKG